MTSGLAAPQRLPSATAFSREPCRARALESINLATKLLDLVCAERILGDGEPLLIQIVHLPSLPAVATLKTR